MDWTMRRQMTVGLIAGTVGALLIDLCLLGAQLAGRPETLSGYLVMLAATVIGPAAARATPLAVPLGVLVQLGLAIAWAVGYVRLVRSQPQLRERPWISGAGFGIVFYGFMEVVLLAANIYRPGNPIAMLIRLLADVVFFGIPVALIVSRLLPPTSVTGQPA